MSRVLLVEDHPRLAEMIVRALAQAGIDCDAWASADEAWAASLVQPYGAALVDRGLPDGDGLQLVRRWRKHGQHMPCLVLTARDALHDRVEGLDAGADDYLSKPFPMEELVARVRALLRRPARQVPLTCQFDDLHLRPEQASLSCGGASIVLPKAELQIMQALLVAGGQPVRRAALETAGWGLQEAVTPGALDVALHRLRKKVQALGSGVKIHNLRAVGYALGR
ncbi:MAG: response regulator transcription factor [Rubrivivax sp.]|nr:response regulator transcription factor [Rubrivivax sp.]